MKKYKEIYPWGEEEEAQLDITGSTPNQERLIDYEFDISEFKTLKDAQEVADAIMQLDNKDEVNTYYSYIRGWADDSDLKSDIKQMVKIYGK